MGGNTGPHFWKPTWRFLGANKIQKFPRLLILKKLERGAYKMDTPKTPAPQVCTCDYHDERHEEQCNLWTIADGPDGQGSASDEEGFEPMTMHGASEGEPSEEEFKRPQKGVKRPLTMISEEAIEDDWELMDPAEPVLPKQPDLRWFFQQYSLNEESQIAICRTHANHLAAMSRVSRGESIGVKPVGRPKSKK